MIPRRDSHGTVSITVSDIPQKSKYSIFPTFLGYLGFNKKKPVVLESQRLDDLEIQYIDNPRRSYQKGNMSNSKGSNVPPLLPSLSDSKMPRTKPSARRNSRKVLVATTAATGSPARSSESGNGKVAGNNGKSVAGNSPSKSGIYSPSKPSGKQSSSVQHDYKNSSKVKDSPPDYSESTTATSVSGYEDSSKLGGYSSKASQTANSLSNGNSQTSRSSILSSIGFGGSSNSNNLSRSSNNNNYNSGVGKLPNTAVISVKPVDDFGSTNRSSTSTSSDNNYFYGGGSGPVAGNGNTVYTSGGTSSTYGKAVKSNNILPMLPGTSSSSNGVTGTIPASTTNAAVPSIPTGKTKPLCCDKCDGKHETDDCPYYKKKREDHPDAQKNSYKMGGVSSLPGNTLYSARVVRQPGDGSCLFHSMSYGLPVKSNAARLRSEICQFIQNNPKFKISDTPLQDWVKWDSNSSVSEYARRMSRGSWGGGIEMACVSQMKDCNVHVYERSGFGYKRISAFDHPVSPETKPVVRVLYCGGVHYVHWEPSETYGMTRIDDWIKTLHFGLLLLLQPSALNPRSPNYVDMSTKPYMSVVATIINDQSILVDPSETDRTVYLRMPMGLTFWADRTGNVLIVSIAPNSAAERCGVVRIGDQVKFVSSIDDANRLPCDNKGLEMVTSWIKAYGSEQVKLVLRYGTCQSELDGFFARQTENAKALATTTTPKRRRIFGYL